MATRKDPRDRVHSTLIKLKSLKCTTNEVSEALKDTKAGKAPVPDRLNPKFLLKSGIYTRKWLAQFFTNIMEKGTIPSVMKITRIIAILIPRKSNDGSKIYRPIALLIAIYKLLEILIYNRIGS